jgi:hypothetical protein
MDPAASGVPVRHLLQWNHPGHMWDMGWRRRGREKGEERQRGRTRLVSCDVAVATTTIASHV